MNTLTLYWLGRPPDADRILADGFHDVPVGTTAEGAPWLGVCLTEEHCIGSAGQPGHEAVLRVTFELPEGARDRYAVPLRRLPGGDYVLPAALLNALATTNRLTPEELEILRAERGDAWADQIERDTRLDDLDNEDTTKPESPP